VARPADTCIVTAIGTSAVAISELLMALTDDPASSGATNRQENAFPWSSLTVARRGIVGTRPP
jgi:hypothetical protein